MALGAVRRGIRQRTLLMYLWSHQRQGRRGMTVRALAAAIGDPSPGNVHNNMAALRLRGALPWRSTGYGPGARIRWQAWPGAECRGGIGTRAFRANPRRVGRSRIDSIAPYGGYLTVGAYEGRLIRDRGGSPPGPSLGPPATSRRPGPLRPVPRRGTPPTSLVGTCATGHLVRIGRWSWTAGTRNEPAQARYRGHCPRSGCGRLVSWEWPGPHGPRLRPDPSPTAAPDVYPSPARARLAAAILAADPSMARYVAPYLSTPEDECP